MPSQPGIELKRSKYRLLGLVGQGQFGQVFCAAHRQTGRLVALKSLDRQRFPTHKFLRELRFLLSLQHSNIVTCQALEHTATGRYLVMDYCEGGTLRSLMAEEQWLSVPQSLRVIADILAGLEHAHSREIVHCDVKPENILLNVQPFGWTARISDFGIARLKQEVADPAFGNTGSPAYMAPERFYGQYSPTSDLYSVGVLLFELLAGHRPFSGTPAELMSAHLNRPVKLPESIPERWQPIIITAMQKLSARRFSSAGEMLSALRAAAGQDGLWLDRPAIALPLFKPIAAVPSCNFPSIPQSLLQQPVVALAVNPAEPLPPSADAAAHAALELYQATTNHVKVQSYSAAGGDHVSIQVDAPIRMLLPRPQGCFVVTQRSISLIAAAPEGYAQALPPVQPVLALPQDAAVAIEAQGRWMATLTRSSSATLAIWRLADHQTAQASAAILTASTAVSYPEPFRSPQLLALNARHLALVVERSAVEGSNLGTLVRIQTRRGTRVGSLILPVRVGQATLTPIAYRLIAHDLDHPHSVLLIDLKPYRILRLGVNIAPTFLLATPWGYILAEPQGQIVFLDLQGQMVGHTTAPAEITAIAFHGQHDLLVATWKQEQGNLYTIDIRELGIDLLF